MLRAQTWDPLNLKVVRCFMPMCICAQHLAPLLTFNDVRRRFAVSELILKTCEIVKGDHWTSVRQCRVCGRLWVVEYPFSETQGGGQPCAYHVDRAALPLRDLTSVLRQHAEDTEFYRILSPEIDRRHVARVRVVDCASAIACSARNITSNRSRADKPHRAAADKPV